MTDTTIAFIVGTCVVGAVGCGLMLENHGYPTHDKEAMWYRMGARMLVTCWAWPLWIVYGIYLLLGAAQWLPDKSSLHKPSWLHWPNRSKRTKDLDTGA